MGGELINQRFFELPEEKRKRVVNAALSVFARYDYKKASTDEIAEAAGISKALLFHYFGSKKELYLYIYGFARDYTIEHMSKSHDYCEEDFFKILLNAQMSKVRLLSEYPDIMLFLVKAYYEESPEVKPEVSVDFARISEDSAGRFIARADLSKFKDEVSPEMVMNIILWMAEGFMRSRSAEQQKALLESNKLFLDHVELLRQQFYKPEYL